MRRRSICASAMRRAERHEVRSQHLPRRLWASVSTSAARAVSARGGDGKAMAARVLRGTRLADADFRPGAGAKALARFAAASDNSVGASAQCTPSAVAVRLSQKVSMMPDRSSTPNRPAVSDQPAARAVRHYRTVRHHRTRPAAKHRSIGSTSISAIRCRSSSAHFRWRRRSSSCNSALRRACVLAIKWLNPFKTLYRARGRRPRPQHRRDLDGCRRDVWTRWIGVWFAAAERWTSCRTGFGAWPSPAASR